MHRVSFPSALFAACLTFSLTCLTVDAGDVAKRIDERFAVENPTEVPDFRQDIVPLLGRLGCNGRACHGSFQGQGGLRLSLFGYDFKSDHEMLAEGEKPRVNVANVDDSLILKKALQIEDHEGGTRFENGSWQHRVLKRWIESGAKPVRENAPELTRLEVTPNEILAKKRGESFVLKVTAVWADGSQCDVTPLCRFRTNNEQIANINDDGVVTTGDPGDTNIVVFYDNGVLPVSVIQPVTEQVGSKYPEIATPTKVDELVIAKLRKLGMIPSGRCSDEEFLRRVSLDMTGTLPTASEVEKFLADRSTDKRAAMIDELLERPAYAAWWATRFADWTGNNSQKLVYNNSGIDQNTRAAEWYEWLRVRIERNMPYDQIAEGIVLAVSRSEGETYAQYCERMSGYYWKEPKGQFADQATMPHYWIRREFLKPEERALGFAYTFLGIRIQCAQCHKHPFDQWTKDDFDRFKEFFSRVKYGTPNSDKGEFESMMAKAQIDLKKLKGADVGRAVREHFNKNEVMPVDELFVLPPNRKVANGKNKDGKRPQVVSGRTSKILGGDEVKIEDLSDPREALMDWLRDEHNPYFARAMANRIWSGYFNVGIVEPVDDLSLANPPSNEALLEYLAAEFRNHNYDMKWLHRTIANSDTYQRSWHPNESNHFDDRNFARAVPRRLPAEVAYDCLQLATLSDKDAAKWKTSLEGRSIAVASTAGKKKGVDNYALTVFGRSTRESNCECDRSTEASLLQTVYRQNDSDVLTMIEGKGRWVEQILKSGEGQSSAEVARRKRSQRFSQLSLPQLRNRLDQAKKRQNQSSVEEIQFEITSREQQNSIADATDVENAPSASLDLNAIISQAYLRTLSRYPNDDEKERAAKYFADSNNVATSARDLLWALVNTKEFVVNH